MSIVLLSKIQKVKLAGRRDAPEIAGAYGRRAKTAAGMIKLTLSEGEPCPKICLMSRSNTVEFEEQ